MSDLASKQVSCLGSFYTWLLTILRKNLKKECFVTRDHLRQITLLHFVHKTEKKVLICLWPTLKYVFLYSLKEKQVPLHYHFFLFRIIRWKSYLKLLIKCWKKILVNARGFLEELGFWAINHRGKISNPRLSPSRDNMWASPLMNAC